MFRWRFSFSLCVFSFHLIFVGLVLFALVVVISYQSFGFEIRRLSATFNLIVFAFRSFIHPKAVECDQSFGNHSSVEQESEREAS